ncbi:hypothetical protein KQX54_009594 [Cotesia glomerata]|uniref:Uncharacterized protein n=1 Tax=Cotesia glomerata TaxID=32391 RepID=A0AAV7I8L4_COTGL|nr:hypothetical protein KQX54_009594 [Cotesia glomerata]
MSENGFITTEVAGTSAIFLYISWHQRDFGKRELSRKNCEDVYHLSNHVHQQNFHPSHSHQTHSSFLCERHQKRYYFSKDSVDQADFDEFLPPLPSLDYHEYPRQFPRDLTTQTISTTADVLNDECGSNMQHEFVTFDFETPFPPLPPIKGSSEWPLEAFRRTTPKVEFLSAKYAKLVENPASSSENESSENEGEKKVKKTKKVKVEVLLSHKEDETQLIVSP